MLLSVEKADNGYVVRKDDNSRLVVCPTLQDVFNELLLQFEDRSPSFVGSKFGQAFVQTDEVAAAVMQEVVSGKLGVIE